MTAADPSALDWDAADRDYELLVDDRLVIHSLDADTIQDRYENSLAGETA